MQEKTKKLITWVSLTVAILIAVCAILFAANQKTFGWAFDVAFWVLLCYIGLSLIIWLFYGIIGVIVAGVVLALGDKMPTDFLLRYETSETAAKLIAIACYITYITVIGALVLMIYSAITKALKK